MKNDEFAKLKRAAQEERKRARNLDRAIEKAAAELQSISEHQDALSREDAKCGVSPAVLDFRGWNIELSPRPSPTGEGHVVMFCGLETIANLFGLFAIKAKPAR
ncbi:MAG: hypothetical protein FWC84_03465 [Alphaproteobacteria bacterium]|nr:hypothetical protein [Alphaproteobacteria bacterium]